MSSENTRVFRQIGVPFTLKEQWLVLKHIGANPETPAIF